MSVRISNRRKSMSKIIGIDLGTANSCVAVMEGEQPVVIANAEGRRTTPSAVVFTREGERLTGQAARRLAVTNADRTVLSVKRELGTSGKVRINGKAYAPEHISAIILGKMKETAESYLGEKVTQAVISVPACFNDIQRQAVKDAGRIAGLEVLRLINEPTAAALSYGLGKEENRKILVYSLGSGSCDVSILDIGDGVFEVLSTCGNSRLGGDDFDRRIVDYAAEQFRKENGIDLRKDTTAALRLKEAAENARIELSSAEITNISLPYIAASASGQKHLDITLTRAKLNELTGDLVNETLVLLQKALKDAGLNANQIDQVILAGGCTKTPSVRDAVKKSVGKEPCREFNPDEAAAVGAAIQGGILSGEVKDVLLLDITPMSLGVETAGHVFTKLIDRNTTIPALRSQIFSTAADNQTTIDIHVLQGEHKMAADNVSLGRFQLTGILPAPKGIPQIQVSFSIDNNGILSISARDQATGSEKQITVTARPNLSENEIMQCAAEEKELAERDRKLREERETLIRADSLIYECEKTLRENGGRLSAEDRHTVQAEINAFRKVRESNRPDLIGSATDRFTEKVYRIFSKLYPQKGDKPYLFASYSHKDSAKVIPILQRMSADGYRIWYDLGIDPGTEWDVNIANHIENCSFFIAFLSDHYLQSSNCQDELSFARELDKKRLLIYLEDLVLPGNLRMRHGRLQAIYHCRYSDPEEFYSKLYAADGIHLCADR